MADDTTSPMHKDFPHWYAPLAIGDDAERRQARWLGVHTLAADSDLTLVEALVRIAFGTSRHPPTVEGAAKVHAAFHKHDDTFDPTKAARELQILAGACLAYLFEWEDDIGIVAALNVTTAALAGERQTDLPLDLITLAEAAISRISVANRARPTLKALTMVPKIDFEAAAAKVKETNNWEAVIAAFPLAAQNVETAFRTLAGRQTETTRAIERFIKVQDEELQMLWWLVGGRSFDLDCSLDSVPAEARPLVFAKELADSTTALPGPHSIKALLSRAGLKDDKSITVQTMINAAPSTWLLQFAGEVDPSPVTQPIHFAIKRQLEVGGGDAWVANWAAVVGVDGAHEVPVLKLALQFYRERLLNVC